MSDSNSRSATRKQRKNEKPKSRSRKSISQADRNPCKFKLSKTILGREIPKEQAQKLLTTGKTDLLDGFISKRGRPFSAYLKFEDGKVGFEFPEKTAEPA